jgi:hypothetical protein
MGIIGMRLDLMGFFSVLVIAVEEINEMFFGRLASVF